MKSLYSILFLLIVTQWCVADVIEYESDYQGIKVGKSTIRKVIGKFGAPLEKKSYSNNVKYIFRNIHVTIQDSTGMVNTIIVFDPEYKDKNAIKIGYSKELVETVLNKKSKANELTDFKNGISYWFENAKVSKIVLAHKLWRFVK